MSFSKSPGCKKKININFPEIFVDTQLNKKSDTPFLHSILDKKPSMVMAKKKCRKININFFFQKQLILILLNSYILKQSILIDTVKKKFD